MYNVSERFVKENSTHLILKYHHGHDYLLTISVGK